MNDLVVATQNYGVERLIDTTPVIGSAVSAATSAASGDWSGGLLGCAGAAMDLAAIAADPIAALASYGVGILLDYVQPLRDALDWLTGNPRAVDAKAATWTNIQTRVGEVRESVLSESAKSADFWEGSGGDAYRAFMSAFGENMVGLGEVCGSVSTAFSQAGVIVAAIRDLVRGLIADLCGALISYAIELLASLGTAAPVVLGQAATKVTAYANKVRSWIQRLFDAMGRLGRLLRVISDSMVSTASSFKEVVTGVLESTFDPQAIGDQITSLLTQLNLGHDLATAGNS